jgi:transposase
MTRRYGRAVGQERCQDSAPVNREKKTTIISTTRLDGSMATQTIAGSLNGELFKIYVKECLAPTLRSGDIVVMDNLRAHKVEGIAEAIKAARATVLYIPPYSPDLNPIEELWSKLKAYLREEKARITGDLLRAIDTGLSLITAQNCVAWVKHAGYFLQSKS